MTLAWIEFAACVAAIAWLSMAEVACFSLSRIEVRRLAQTDPRGAILARLLADPPRVFSTIVTLNTAASVGASASAVALVESSVPLSGSALVAVTTIMASLVLLIAGDITPKTFAVRHADAVALAVARPLSVLGVLLRPFTRALVGLGHAAARLARRGVPRASRADDLIATIDAGRTEGVLARDERALLVGALVSGQRTVAEVMLPWPRVVTVNESATMQAALETMRVRRVTRAPIVSADGRVVGIVRVQDLLTVYMDAPGDRRSVREVARPAFYAPRDTTWGDALRAIQRDRSYVLIVGTPGRRPLGLVVLRDLLSELVDAEHEAPA